MLAGLRFITFSIHVSSYFDVTYVCRPSSITEKDIVSTRENYLKYQPSYVNIYQSNAFFLGLHNYYLMEIVSLRSLITVNFKSKL